MRRRSDRARDWPEYDLIDAIFAVGAAVRRTDLDPPAEPGAPPYDPADLPPWDAELVDHVFGPEPRWHARGAELVDLSRGLGDDPTHLAPWIVWGAPGGAGR